MGPVQHNLLPAQGNFFIVGGYCYLNYQIVRIVVTQHNYVSGHCATLEGTNEKRARGPRSRHEKRRGEKLMSILLLREKPLAWNIDKVASARAV